MVGVASVVVNVPVCRFVRKIVTVFPAPVAVIPLSKLLTVSAVKIFRTFKAGTAVPLSVTILVGTVGGTGAVVVLTIPACEILHLLNYACTTY